MTEVFEGLTEQQLYELLPKTLRERLYQLNSTNQASWDEVGQLLAAAPTAGIALKGGRWDGQFWTATKKEFASFLCSDSSEYTDLRREWESRRQKGLQVGVASLSGAIGAHVGVTGGVIAPMVIWLLLVGVRIGKNALCAVLASTQEAEDPAPPSGDA